MVPSYKIRIKLKSDLDALIRFYFNVLYNGKINC